ncbi:hypothetical protein WMY93_019830 [Mugilogobius chulae]|uniref:Bactericidal permeability-increasing protein n=1 Tax=Mugilogobius chulae TaxID=88201 RepID=A0AAW0NQC5_9GOBI
MLELIKKLALDGRSSPKSSADVGEIHYARSFVTPSQMFLHVWLLFVALTTLTSAVNPGVKVKLTQKGLDYGRMLGIATIQQKLQTIKLPDVSGSQKVNPIGKVSYSFTNMHIINVGLPQSAVSLVPDAGVKLSIGNAYMSLNGNWRVKYLKFIKDSGSFDLDINGMSISTTITVNSDETGRPTVSGNNCMASVGSVSIKFHGGASWLYNLFKSFIEKALRGALEKQICPLVVDAISDVNPYLKTLNVLAKVDEYAEIQYSMVSSPVITTDSVDLSLKGEFYNIGKHQEPPFSPPVFSLPSQSSNMLYMGLSSYTANTAGFVYTKAGALSLYITDDMIPPSSPIRLNTQTFGAFIPQLAKLFPGLMMKLLVKAEKNPSIIFEPKNATIQASGTVTAYAIQANGTLSPLFVLNMNGFDPGTSYIGDFQVKSLDTIFQMVLKSVILPKVNDILAKGYPLPTIGMMKLVNTQLQLMKNVLILLCLEGGLVASAFFKCNFSHCDLSSWCVWFLQQLPMMEKGALLVLLCLFVTVSGLPLYPSIRFGQRDTSILMTSSVEGPAQQFDDDVTGGAETAEIRLGRHADAIFTNGYRKVLGQVSARKFLQTIMGKRLGEESESYMKRLSNIYEGTYKEDLTSIHSKHRYTGLQQHY